MLNICFITDGGAHLGLGHVQQSIAFARELLSDADIQFITKSDQTVVDKITSSGFPTSRLQDDAQIFAVLQTTDPDVVIFDKLDVAEDLASNIRSQLRARLVIFTNLTLANRHADIAVTADIGSRFENIRFTDEETRTEYLYGPKYWVMRREFDEYQKLGKPRTANVDRVLLIFGGSDPANLTSATLEQLLALPRPPLIDVVLGAHFCHDIDVEAVLERYCGQASQVTVHRNIANVAELMHRADLVLASPGLSAFEALKVGTPIIVVPHDDLQRDTYQGFMRMLERHQLQKLGDMLDRRDFTYPQDAQIARMEIGKGTQDLKALVTSPLRKDTQ